MFLAEELLNIKGLTVTSYRIEEEKIYLKIGYFKENCECPHCGNITDDINQIRGVSIRDMPILGKKTILEIGRRQFYCQDCKKYFTEPLRVIDFPRQITKRYKNYIFERVKVSTITEIAKEESLTYDQVKGIFEERYAKKKESCD